MAYEPSDYDGGFFGPTAAYPDGTILDGTTRVNDKQDGTCCSFSSKC
jgi:hypothetical protein